MVGADPSAFLGILVLVTLLDARIGYIIRRERRNLKLSLDMLGKMVGVNHSTISNYETGVRPVPFDRAQLLALALGLDLRLIDRTADQSGPPPKIRPDVKVNVGPVHRGCVCTGECTLGDVPEFLS
ncbi:helix-turn-helix domain-containing protein [Arthrobacter sp. alpha11c]